MKKILLIILLLIPFAVKAEVCEDDKIVIESAVLKETNGVVDETKELSIDGKTFGINLGMLETGNSANYELVVKNNSNADYEIDFSKVKSGSEYITYTVTTENNSRIVKAGKTLGVSLLITYANEIPSAQFVDGVFHEDNHIVLNLYNEKQNPNTLVGSKAIIITIILALCFIVAITVFKKRKAVYLIPIIIASMTSIFVVKALCKSELEVNASIVISNGLINNLYQKEEGYLSSGDQIQIGNTEQFYVVSSNENQTVLLARYTLHVGEVYEDRLRTKTLTEDDFGYGLQHKKPSYNHAGGTIESIGMVPFSGKQYWLDENNNIIEQYGSTNISPMVGINIYDNTYNSELYEIDENSLNENGECLEGSCKTIANDYSVAYFVNKYVERLEDMGLEVEEGRLLKDTEAATLGCGTGNSNYAFCPQTINWLYYDQFWIDGLYSMGWPRVLSRHQMESKEYNKIVAGVRPVIVIDTSLIPLKSHEYFVNRESQQP